MSSGEIIAALQPAAQKPKVISLPTAAKSEETIAGPASSGHSSQDVTSKERALYKKHFRPIWNLRYMFFSVYRKLFGITFAANVSVFISLTATHQASTGKVTCAVVSNLFVSIPVRQEHVINTRSVSSGPDLSPPLSPSRRISAHIFHIGGRKYSSSLPIEIEWLEFSSALRLWHFRYYLADSLRRYARS